MVAVCLYPNTQIVVLDGRCRKELTGSKVSDEPQRQMYTPYQHIVKIIQLRQQDAAIWLRAQKAEGEPSIGGHSSLGDKRLSL